MSGSRSLTDAEIQDITTLLPIRDSALVILGVRSGFRISELLSIKVSDVTQYGAIANTVTVSKSKMKGQRASRTVPLHDEAKAILKRLIEYLGLTADSYLFQSRKGDNKPISREHANRVITDTVKLLGLEGRITSHSLRKSLASRVYEASGKDLRVTQLALGHASLTSTQHYLQVDQSEVDDIILKLK